MAVMAPSSTEAPSNGNVVSIFRNRLGLPPLPGTPSTGGGQPAGRSNGPVKCLFGSPDVQESQALCQKVEERAQWSFSRKWNYNITGNLVAPTKLESSNPEPSESESGRYEWSPLTPQNLLTPTSSPIPSPKKKPQPQRRTTTTTTILSFDSPPSNNLRCLRIRNGSHSGSRIMKQKAITDYVQVRKGVFKNKKNQKTLSASASDLTKLQKESTGFAIVFQHSS